MKGSGGEGSEESKSMDDPKRKHVVCITHHNTAHCRH